MTASRLSLTDERYRAAAAFTPPAVHGLVRNAGIKPHWIGDRGLFWYERQSAEGRGFVLIDPVRRTRQPAFDHQIAAEALSRILERPITPSDLPVDALTIASDLSSVEIRSGAHTVIIDGISGRYRFEAAMRSFPDWLVSPDKRKAIFRGGDNIHLRDLKTGDERPLTADGDINYSYGLLPGSNVLALSARRGGRALPPHGAVWSPDSRLVAIPRVDERDLPRYPFMEFAPKDGTARPVIHELPRPLLGDAKRAQVTYFIIDIETGATKRIEIPEGLSIFLGHGSCWWDAANTTLSAIAQDVPYRRACLLAIDVETGGSRIAIEERCATHHDFNLEPYRCANVHVMDDGGEAVWFSQRDGWGHLYLYDLTTGTVRRRLTEGDWAVADILHVDEKRRRLLFSGGSRDEGRDPYYRYLYRVDLDEGEPVLLTPEDADHAYRAAPRPQESFLLMWARPEPLISPKGDFCIDIRSTVAMPPVTALRSTETGEVLMLLEMADTAALTAKGYKPPEPFIEKAADDETDLYGLIHYPPDFDPNLSYPVIDAMLVAPHQTAVLQHFTGAVWDWNPPGPYALSRLGFIVVQLDGRGSTRRGKAFHDFGYGNLGQSGLADHAAVLRQLAKRIPAMDLSRLGAYGYSLGGYYAARALLAYPDLYKAAVAIGGSYHAEGQVPGFLQKWQGPVTPDEIPDSYRGLDCRGLAGQMEGQLLLVTGDLDDVAPAALTFQLADALIKHGKDVEVLLMPGRDHTTLSTDPYVLRRMWDFFLRHLA